jgi:nicotinamidase-related amidase
MNAISNAGLTMHAANSVSLSMHAASSVLVLVDYQTRLLPAIDHGERVVAQAVLLADAARLLGIRIVGTEQNPQGLGANAQEIRTRCDTTLAKMHFDACADGLVDMLTHGNHGHDDRAGGARPEIVIAGCESHVCLLQTALGLLDRGFRVWVVASACGSRRPSDKAAAMQRLQAAGATVVTTEMVLFEWLRSCDHESFKPLLRRLKQLDAKDDGT